MNKDFIQKSKTNKNSKISSKVGVILLISFAILNIILLIEPVLNNSKNKENYLNKENIQRSESDVYSNLYKNFENKDFLKQQIKILNEDLARQPDSFNYVTRGGLYFLLKKYQSALSDMNKALKLEPDNMDAYFYRGLTRLSMKSNVGSHNDKKGCNDIKIAYEAGQ